MSDALCNVHDPVEVHRCDDDASCEHEPCEHSVYAEDAQITVSIVWWCRKCGALSEVKHAKDARHADEPTTWRTPE